MKNFRRFSLIISVLFAACGISKKDLAKRCADEFPQPPSVVRVVKIDSSHTDTLWQTNETISYLDTTQCPPSDTGLTIYKIVPCKCPPSPIVTKTKYETIIETRVERDSAESYLRYLEVQKLKAVNIKIATKNIFLMFLTGGALVLAMLFLFLLGRQKSKTDPSVKN
jgi:hypothetical protein